MTAVSSVKIQAELTANTDAQTLTFSRQWSVSRLMFHLSSGQTALLNVSFFVVDADLSCEDLPVANLVLRHLGTDSRTLLLLEHHRECLNGIDLRYKDYSKTRGNTNMVGCLLLVRPQQRLTKTEKLSEWNLDGGINQRHLETEMSHLNSLRARVHFLQLRREIETFLG